MDGLNKEQRSKIDAALEGRDATTGADRREAMRKAGLSESRIDQMMRVNRSDDPTVRAEAKVKMAMEARRRREATKAKGDG